MATALLRGGLSKRVAGAGLARLAPAATPAAPLLRRTQPAPTVGGLLRPFLLPRASFSSENEKEYMVKSEYDQLVTRYKELQDINESDRKMATSFKKLAELRGLLPAQLPSSDKFIVAAQDYFVPKTSLALRDALWQTLSVLFMGGVLVAVAYSRQYNADHMRAATLAFVVYSYPTLSSFFKVVK